MICGEFDIKSDKPHGRILIMTEDLLEFTHMDQGIRKGESIKYDTKFLKCDEEILLILAHKAITEDKGPPGQLKGLSENANFQTKY